MSNRYEARWKVKWKCVGKEVGKAAMISKERGLNYVINNWNNYHESFVTRALHRFLILTATIQLVVY